MTTTTTAVASSPNAHRAPTVHPTVRARKTTAAILTSAGIALALVFGLTFGGFGLFTVAFSLILPLVLIWGSSDVLRGDEVRS